MEQTLASLRRNIMQPVQQCATYHAVSSGRELFRGADGKTALKVYYFDIIGRPDPARTVWKLCGLNRADFLSALGRAEAADGIGFVTAFPHISKVFRFDPQREIIMNVRAYATPQMKPLDLARGEGYMEFACLAEALVAAEEFAFWAEAKTVEEYLGLWSTVDDCLIAVNDKLMSYWKA
jgi:hypothetical protein